MGKLFSFLASMKSTKSKERKKQEWVLRNIASNENIEWENPEQRLTVTEAAQAAHRLSIYDEKPQDTDECKQYEEDNAKVEAGITAVKQNYKKGNKNEINRTISQSESLKDDEQKQFETENNTQVEVNQDQKQIENESEIRNAEEFDAEIIIKDDVKEIEIETETKVNENMETETEKFYKEIQIETDLDRLSTFEEPVPKTYDGPKAFEAEINAQRQSETESYPDEKDQDIVSEMKINTSSNFIRKNSAKFIKQNAYSGKRIVVTPTSEKQIILTNSHNFLWLTTAIQNGLNSIIESIANEEEGADELTRVSLNKHLHILPPAFRDKVWYICTGGEEMDVIWPEIYKVFVDSLSIATGQYDIDDDISELMFEIRDMTETFNQIVDIDKIFKDKRNTANWSKTTLCLSTKGAKALIKASRNMKSDRRLVPSDNMAIALLTGYTREAIENAVFFCTGVFWKMVTDRWWNADDDDEYPMSLSRTVTANQRQALNAVSLEALFPDLILFDDDDQDGEETFTQYLRALE